MLLLASATLAMLAFGILVAASLDLPSRSATGIAAITLTLVSITAIVQTTLVIGAFTLPIVTTLALCLPVLSGVVVACSARLRRRVVSTAAAFRVGGGATPEHQSVPSLAAGAALAMLAATYLNRIWVDLRIPPLDWDSNSYHLVAVGSWVRSGRLGIPIGGLNPPDSLPRLAWVDSYPHQSELIDAWLAVFPHSTRYTTLLQIPFAVLLVATTYGLCRLAKCQRNVSLIAACIAGLIPMTLAQVTTSYNDVARAATLVAGWYFLVLAWNRVGESRRRVLLVLSGVALGFSTAVKALSLPAILAALVVATVAGATIGWWETSAARGRNTTRRDAAVSGLTAAVWLGVPAGAITAFWYVRTWIRWGSPFWPIQVGPLAGPIDPSTMSGGHESVLANLAEMLRGWGAGLSAMSSPVVYDTQHGPLGPTWLLVLAPAVVVATLMWRRNRSALVTIVYPILLLNLFLGTRVQPRYALAITVAGAVAFALVVQDLASRPRGTRRFARATAAGVVGLALLLTGWGASAAVLRPNWAFEPGGGHLAPASYWTGVHQYFTFLTSPAKVRRTGDFWRDVNLIQAGIPAHETIGLASGAPPNLIAPWMGSDFTHALVLIRGSSLDQLATSMSASGVHYLVTAAGELNDLLRADDSGRFIQAQTSASCLDYNTCGAAYVWHLVR